MKRYLAVLLLLLLLPAVMLPACSPGDSRRRSEPEVKPVWPPPPAPARIAWEGEIRDFADYRRGQGFWQRLGKLLVGREQVGLVKPYGIYVDADQRLFVVDNGAGRLYLVDRRRGRYRVIPPGEQTPFSSPIDVTGDGQGTVYITDSRAGKIFRYRLDSRVLSPFPAANLRRPTGITYYPRLQVLYVADALAHQVIAYGLDGRERFRFGSRGRRPGQFNAPTAVVLNRDDELLVTDALNSRIQVFSPEGQFIAAYGRPGDTSGSFAKPKGIAADSDGHFYVCDALFDAVQVFDRHGLLLLTFGNSGSRPGQFWMPTGIFIDSHDYIYVADTYNRRIQIFRYLRPESGRDGGQNAGKRRLRRSRPAVGSRAGAAG